MRRLVFAATIERDIRQTLKAPFLIPVSLTMAAKDNWGRKGVAHILRALNCGADHFCGFYATKDFDERSHTWAF